MTSRLFKILVLFTNNLTAIHTPANDDVRYVVTSEAPNLCFQGNILFNDSGTAPDNIWPYIDAE